MTTYTNKNIYIPYLPNSYSTIAVLLDLATRTPTTPHSSPLIDIAGQKKK